MTEHWIDRRRREGKPINLIGFVNPPRMSAQVILKLVNWRNEMNGIKRSLFEEDLIYQEKNEQIVDF